MGMQDRARSEEARGSNGDAAMIETIMETLRLSFFIAAFLKFLLCRFIYTHTHTHFRAREKTKIPREENPSRGGEMRFKCITHSRISLPVKLEYKCRAGDRDKTKENGKPRNSYDWHAANVDRESRIDASIRRTVSRCGCHGLAFLANLLPGSVGLTRMNGSING